MSMSVPLLWQEVVWEPEWGTYRGTSVAGNTIVDGGLLSNFPGFLGPGGEPKTGLLSNLDHLASNWLLPIGGLLITVGVGWFTTRDTTETELVDSTTPAWFRYGAWRFIIRYIAPLAVFTIICFVIFGGEDFS